MFLSQHFRAVFFTVYIDIYDCIGFGGTIRYKISNVLYICCINISKDNV